MRRSRLNLGASNTNGIKAILGVILIVVGSWINTQGAPWKGNYQEALPYNLGVTVSMIGVILLLWFIIEMFYWSPLSKAINDRNQALEDTFSEAENLREQMTQMKADYERQLAETERQAREEIQKQIREAQDLRTKLMAEANEKADQMLKRAQEEIANERDKVLTQLRIDVANLTLKATEKIIGEQMDADRNRKIVDEFIDELEVNRN